MNMYKFGNYICKLREEKNLTQAELANQLDVSDKSISKWENGQAFPRIETFEKLAVALDTTVEDIFSASKDGIKRICIANNFYYVMQIDVDGQLYTIRADESKWVEINDNKDSMVIKITGEFLTDESFGELDNSAAKLKDKIMFKVMKKATTELMSLILQVDCTYKISNIQPDSLITVEHDGFDLGDKTLMFQDFQIMYPKIVCGSGTLVELLKAKGKNSKEIIKKYKKLGLASDMGMDFIDMILAYPLRGMYFKHLCKPAILKKNILKAEVHKENTEKRNSGKKIGCLGGCFSIIALLLVWFVLDIFVFSVLFVASEKPYLVASDYSSITYKDNVYVRIDELPEYAYPTTMLGASIWEDTRTDGLSKWDQSMQGDKVQLFEDDEGREYLWLVEDYADNILGANDNGEDKEYEDFDEHYVYVCENP
ncbi:MAG: helix-turn-helix transcriptional regulator [Clostridia bacterium]|nr:helix-turn-helix transcriptional regulator [Clostridia bacterium]